MIIHTLKLKQIFSLLIFFLVTNFSIAQTTLTAGNLVISGYNSDAGDQFSFVLLTDITINTVINFTDNGWMSTGSFRSGEGVLTWTADQALTCGTEIIVFRTSDSNPFTATIGDVVATSGLFTLATGGDQITAFQGTLSTPTNILYIINFNSLSWTDATNSNNTALPTGLTDGTTAVSLGNRDNGTYDCSVDNDTSALLTTVSNSTNWLTNNSTPYTLGSCSYFCNIDTVDWCNLQWPDVGNISLGGAFVVYGQVYEPGVTNSGGQGAGITSWIGFSTTNAITTSDFNSSNWTWVPATYNTDVGNNDEYLADIGSYIPASGTYYFVTRFQYNNGPYTYGGYSPAPGGGFWDGTTYVSNILTVNSTCTSVVTWNGSWTPASGPDITTEVVIASDYDSTSLPSFSACRLTVNAGANLIIDNSKHVLVNNDIVINGSMLIRTDGSLVQVNDAATITGTASVEKSTAPLNNWYEYTYWSSPVSNETVGNGLNESDTNRRFLFNANNFEDATAETNNNDAIVAGQDDIDDNGDDWQYVVATTTMTPGVGYAATHNLIGFMGIGTSYTYTFNGTPNNGVVTVPVVRNDLETNDINWNFIGNPYPSAIDADLFFAKNLYNGLTNPNGKLAGSIYLWSQNTAPQNTNNGNESFNFSTSDYAIINGTGQVAGGDMITPNRYIPSGQGFFIAYTDTTVPASGNIEFNNSMRVTGNNDQFFRMSNNLGQSNKLSINLTSNNGVFNQAMVGYVNGATDSNDGMFYDAPRNLSSGAAAIIYSVIDNNPRKFAIQGKSPSSLNNDEVITIGFKNTIETETQFTLSLVNLEGEFITNTPIYLIDNLLNLEHNLSASAYTFTSEVGEFDNRFEIRFASTLSIGELNSEVERLNVIDADNSLEFFTTNHSVITNLQVFDMLGRTLYNIENNSNSLIIKTSQLKNSVLIANVTLANGKVLSKKILY